MPVAAAAVAAVDSAVAAVDSAVAASAVAGAAAVAAVAAGASAVAGAATGVLASLTILTNLLTRDVSNQHTQVHGADLTMASVVVQEMDKVEHSHTIT